MEIYGNNILKRIALNLTPSPSAQLLEQALAVEEQLHRASNAGLVQDPNRAVMQLHSHFTDLDCLADGHAHLSRECMDKEKNSIQLMRKGGGTLCIHVCGAKAYIHT